MTTLFGPAPRATRLAHALGRAEAMTQRAIPVGTAFPTLLHRLRREADLRRALLSEMRHNDDNRRVQGSIEP